MTQQQRSRAFSVQQTYLILLFICCCIAACNNAEQKPAENVVVKNPEQADAKASELMRQLLQYAGEHENKINDSVVLKQLQLLNTIYTENGYQPIWSEKEQWNTIADSLYQFIYLGKTYGLFPSDYALSSILNIRNGLVADTLHRRNAALWARADLILTNAYLNIASDLKLGRLPKDSVTLRNDSLINADYFLQNFRQALAEKNIRGGLDTLEPKLQGYQRLKAAIPAFLDSVNFTPTTYVVYPNKDSAAMVKQLAQRLTEAGFPADPADSGSFKRAIRSYQQQQGFTITGKPGEKTIRSLNNSNWEKFKRIAITLDRYKLLTDTLPSRHIWVNLPGFYMQLWDSDTLYMQSKVVVGKPQTRTPVLTSKLTDMITYPQWTIPTSIIVKEVLPGVKKDSNYFAKKGYSVIDSEGAEVDPHQVNWFKYSKGIPYKVVQGSGDDNALGILKFNFSNKYSVYLHDTNQRYFFKNAMRALSHGCVRVQSWDKLAYYIIQNDSLSSSTPASAFKSDSLRTWLVRKEKHYIPIRNRIPLYIRYYTVEGKDGKVLFYDDIYGEDRLLSERYFANKAIY
jgi:L,D-transpeptidase YcbB